MMMIMMITINYFDYIDFNQPNMTKFIRLNHVSKEEPYHEHSNVLRIGRKYIHSWVTVPCDSLDYEEWKTKAHIDSKNISMTEFKWTWFEISIKVHSNLYLKGFMHEWIPKTDLAKLTIPKFIHAPYFKVLEKATKIQIECWEFIHLFALPSGGIIADVGLRVVPID